MKFLFDDQILPTINEILRKASSADTVYLVSPYLKLNDRVRQAVEQAANNRADLVFITRRNVPDRSDDDIRWLLDRRVRVYELEFLHAKIFWSKSEAVVTSMNLHDASDRSSREIAITFEEQEKIEELRQVIESWKATAIELKPSQLATHPAQAEHRVMKPAAKTGEQSAVKTVAVTPQPSGKAKGFCIRCGEPKTFNPKSPLCKVCYDKWAVYKNDKYPEKFCHRCKRPSTTTINQPLCERCSPA